MFSKYHVYNNAHNPLNDPRIELGTGNRLRNDYITSSTRDIYLLGSPAAPTTARELSAAVNPDQLRQKLLNLNSSPTNCVKSNGYI
jgi:hypothetical protein